MADVLAVRDEYRAQTWASLIQECSSSGLSKREFCRERGISEKSFYIGSENCGIRRCSPPVPSWYSWNLVQLRRICSKFNTRGRS
ncbi:IS66 family insertion sequence element accessory protein TnpA [Agathobaculum sp.]|uniref:IS66 family insertion sequence element accessory protein TnpA n=1 Tax=Agathobaculum sp. TaxID=2048138 RepID=UPI003FA42FBD